MKAKEIIERLGKMDPEKEVIWVDGDFSISMIEEGRSEIYMY